MSTNALGKKSQESISVLILHDVTLIATYMPKPPPLHMAGPVCCMDSTDTGGRLPPLFPEMAELSKSEGRLEGKCSISQAALTAGRSPGSRSKF